MTLSLTLRRVHRTSAVVLLVYGVLHLLNHLTAIAGATTHIAVMERLRLLYRNPVGEGVLLLSVVAQIVTGVCLMWRGRGTRRTAWAKLQAWSGFYLTFFLLQHVSAALLSRYVARLDTNFYWAASVLSQSPLRYYYIPYYGLGVTAFSVHVAGALRVRLAVRLKPAGARRVATFVVMVGVLTAALILIAFGGGFYLVSLPHGTPSAP